MHDLLVKTGLAGDIEDAAILPIPQTDLILVKNIDIMTPIIDEPSIMGEIAACNVTNDIFAMNVPEISGMLVFLAIQTHTPIEVAEGILLGIKNFMENKINSQVVGGHTIYSGWPLIGGEANGFAHKDTIIPKAGVKEGDKLILTKPIGLQAIMAAYRVQKEFPEILEQYSDSELKSSIDLAIQVMTTSNQETVKTIRSYEDFSFIHAMSDVTGFGLAGHLEEMLQHTNLSALITRTPSITLSKDLSDLFGYSFKTCRCNETAGGMLISIDSDHMDQFSERLARNGVKNWIVGEIDKFKPQVVRVANNVQNVEVSRI